MKKLLCLFGFHNYLKYERLTNVYNRTNTEYIIMCSKCKKVKYNSKNK